MLSRVIGFVLCSACLFILLLTSPGLGQQGSGRPKDAKSSFEFMAGKGNNEIIISKIYFGKEAMEEFAKKQGITNGKLTFEQYSVYYEERAALRAKGGGDKFGKGSGGDKSTKGSWGGFSFGKKDSEKKQPDRKDPEKKEPDKKEAEASRNNPNASPGIVTKVYVDEETDRLPVIYRAGKLPKDLPAWFEECDLDKDGQVDLGEWRAAGKSIAEFKKMDRNDDGLLTAEEVLYFLAKGSDEKTASSQGEGNPWLSKEVLEGAGQDRKKKGSR